MIFSLFSDFFLFYFIATRIPCLDDFFGVHFEAGNETRENFGSCVGAEQNRRVERGFYSFRCFREIEKLRCEKFL